MGCVNSTVDDKQLDSGSEEQKKKQRRRLSVDLNAPMTPAEQVTAARYTGGFAVESRKGVVPYNRNKVNQDRALFKLAMKGDSDLSLFGVMDGHGEFGHYVAGFVQEKLPHNLALQDLKAKPAASILAATDATCKQLAKSGINCTFSGTTCVYGLQVADRLYVANIGDSRCVMHFRIRICIRLRIRLRLRVRIPSPPHSVASVASAYRVRARLTLFRRTARSYAHPFSQSLHSTAVPHTAHTSVALSLCSPRHAPRSAL